MTSTTYTPKPTPLPEQFTNLEDYRQARTMQAAEAAHYASVGEWHTAQKRAKLIGLPAQFGLRSYEELIRAIQKIHRKPRAAKSAAPTTDN